MTVATEDRERVLPAQSCDPEVVRRDRSSGLPQLEMDCRVVVCGPFVDVEDRAVCDKFIQPPLVPRLVTGLGNAITIFPQDDDGKRQFFRF